MMLGLESSAPDIPSFYSGRSIFITGASGFMGKVLVERLLTTCPDIKKLYLLLREKRGVSPEQRLEHLKQSQVFDSLRSNNPVQMEKLVPVAGDVTQHQLGLTRAARALLNEVSVVFHSAATVKMHEELKQSVDQNLRCVITLLQLCDTLPKLDVFVHVSTAFSNAELSRIEEKVYPPPMDLQTLLDIMDGRVVMSQEQFKRVTASKPNTYTFTKAMAEHAIDQHGCSRYPVAIFRPTIVISALQHPFPGWIDNLNGPSGVIAGVSSGQLQVFRTKRSARADMVPVDLVIDTLIAVAWETALYKSSKVRVYNCSTYENPTTWGEFESTLNAIIPLFPSSKAIMYPHLRVIHNRYCHRLAELFLQTLPVYLIEYLTRFVGVTKSVNLIHANQKLQAMNKALEFFSIREWYFKTENTKRLRDRLSEKDRAVFHLDTRTINWRDLLTNHIIGIRRYVLKEGDKDLETARARIQMFRIFNTITKVLIILIGLRFINQRASFKLFKTTNLLS